jgi:predicted ester cyclase
MNGDAVRELLRREVTPSLYTEVRELWKAHSIAEDARDIPGLIATLTEDCVYEVPQFGAEWRGHAGAERFYRELIGAFPDIHFDLRNIVIGPQGVYEEAAVTGTHKARWLEFSPSGRRVEFTVTIFFPWDLARKKFQGERVYVDVAALRGA